MGRTSNYLLLHCRIIAVVVAIDITLLISSSFRADAIFEEPIPDKQIPLDEGPLPRLLIQNAPYRPFVEYWSTPVNPTEGLPFTVFARVHDEFGEIQEAILSYSSINGPSESIQMELTDGTLRNGTYAGTVPQARAGALDIGLSFKDNLGYRNAVSFHYLVQKDTNAPSISCWLSSTATLAWEPIKATCTAKDDWSGVKEILLYGNGGRSSFQFLSNMIIVNATGETGADNKSGYVRYWALSKSFESANSYAPGVPGTRGEFYAIARDYSGNERKSEPMPYSVNSEEESLLMNVNIVNLDTSTMKLRTDLQADGKINNVVYDGNKLRDIFFPAIEVTYVPSYAKEDVGKNNSRTLYSLPFVNVPINQPAPTSEVLPLEGKPWLFPFDSYSIDLIFSNKVPSSKIDVTDPVISLDESLRSQWEIVKPSTPNAMSAKDNSVSNGPTITHVEFERNPYVAAGLYLPLFGVFFLLGAVLILENDPEQLSNKLAISIGVFAFIFAFTQIDALKPATSGLPTIADMMIFSAAIATIAYGISSAVSISLLKTRYRRWPIDGAIFISMSIFISIFFISQTNYPPEMIAAMLLIIITGLGYGIALRFLLSRHKSRLKARQVGRTPDS